MSEIVGLTEALFEPLRRALDVVARERRYLALTEAPPAEQAHEFYRRVIAQNLVMFLAVTNGEVVGWCDALPTYGQSRAHVAVLGIGVVPEHRGRGIGRKLLQDTMARAWGAGFSRIELTVRVDNLPARALYKGCGFQTEGLQIHAFRIDGAYFDAFSMAALHGNDA
jgi:putative acetyltransferase